MVVVRNATVGGRLELGNEMLLFGSAALIFATLICVNSAICMSNFGYGLKPLLSFGEKPRQEYEFRPLMLRPGNHSFVSKRFDLD